MWKSRSASMYERQHATWTARAGMLVASDERSKHDIIFSRSANPAMLRLFSGFTFCPSHNIPTIGVIYTQWLHTKHLSIQTNHTPVLSILLYASETWTSLASDMKTIESFQMTYQRGILGIRWNDFVGNSEIFLRTGLAPVPDRITRGRNAIFRHVARLPDNIPAHQAMLGQVELSVGRPPDPTWKRLSRLCVNDDDDDCMKKCMEYEAEGSRPRGRPKRTWTEVVETDCQACKLNKEDAVDCSRWRKLIKDVWWSGWVSVGTSPPG